MPFARCIAHVLLPAVVGTGGGGLLTGRGGRCQICVFLASLPRRMSEGSTSAWKPHLLLALSGVEELIKWYLSQCIFTDTITWGCWTCRSWRTALYSFKTIKSLLRPVAPQFDNDAKYIFSGYWTVGVASIMKLLEEATLGCVFSPSVRWAHISSQVLASFLAKLPPCSYVPERKDMSNWGQCEPQLTVIISEMEQWEGTSPNEASTDSKAWRPLWYDSPLLPEPWNISWNDGS